MYDHEWFKYITDLTDKMTELRKRGIQEMHWAPDNHGYMLIWHEN